MDTPTKVDVQAVSAHDQELVYLLLQSIRGGEPKVDYPRLTEAAGLPNIKSAQNWWYNLRKRLQLSFGTDDAAAGKAPAAKRARKPKKAAADTADADGMLTPPSTPPSGRKCKAAVLDKQDKGDKDEGNSTDGQDGNDDDDKATSKAADKNANKDANKDGSNDATMADASQAGQASAADATTGDATTADDLAGDSTVTVAVPAAPAADGTSTTPAAPKKKRATTPRARGAGRGKNAKAADNASSGVAKDDAAKVDAAKEDSDDD